MSALKSKNGFGQVTNLGSGYEITVGEVAKLIAEIMDCEINFISDEQRVRPKASEVDRLLAITQKPKRVRLEPCFSGRMG